MILLRLKQHLRPFVSTIMTIEIKFLVLKPIN